MNIRTLLMIAVIRIVSLPQLVRWSERANNLLRIKFADELRLKHENHVRLGPLEGLRIPALKRSKWSFSSDHTSMVMGEYESAFIQVVVENGPYDALVDIGSSWGLYVFGLPRAQVVEGPIVAFELNYEDQMYLGRRASEEGLEVTVRGGATTEGIKACLASSRAQRGLVICDVEGFEYDLWTEDVAIEAKDWFLAVELHDETKNVRLKEILSHTHDLSIIDQFQKSLSEEAVQLIHQVLPAIELRDFTVATILSEGRRSGQQWLFASPKNLNSESNPVFP